MTSGKVQVGIGRYPPTFKPRLPETVLVVSMTSDGVSHQVECYERWKDDMVLSKSWTVAASAVSAGEIDNVGAAIADIFYQWFRSNIGFQEELPLDPDA